jgi:hypothetical protein
MTTPAELKALSDDIMPGNWCVDERASAIWTDHLHGGKVFDIRGWGFLTGGGAMRLRADDAERMQRATAEAVCALVNAYRAGEYVHRSELEAAKAEQREADATKIGDLEALLSIAETRLALFETNAHLDMQAALAEVGRLTEVLRDIAGNGDPDFPSYSQIVAKSAIREGKRA